MTRWTLQTVLINCPNIPSKHNQRISFNILSFVESNADEEGNEDDDSESSLNTEDEEDEVVKAMIRSKKVNRDHPPQISIEDINKDRQNLSNNDSRVDDEDIIMDICFHPTEDLIGLANASGDIHM